MSERRATAIPTVAVVMKCWPRLTETFIAQEMAGLEECGVPIEIWSLRHPTDAATHPVHARVKAAVKYLPEYLEEDRARVRRASARVRHLPGYRIAWQRFRKDLARDRTANRVRRFGQALVLAAELPVAMLLLTIGFVHLDPEDKWSRAGFQVLVVGFALLRVGDVVVLLNPAFEASRFEPVFSVAQSRARYAPNQRPVFVAVTSTEDKATRIAFPVGHHATLLVALPHTLAAPGSLPGGLPTRASVVRGWTATVERASRILTPDPRWNERVVAERCELALAGPAHPDDDPVGFLIGLGQLVRMGERDVDGWAPDLAHALELAGKSAVRGPGGDDWAFEAAVDAADAVLDSMGDQRARRDLASLRAHVSGPRAVGSTARAAALPDDEPVDGARFLAWIERRIVLVAVVAIAAGGIGLPYLDHRIGHRRPFSVEHAALDANPLAARLDRVLEERQGRRLYRRGQDLHPLARDRANPGRGQRARRAEHRGAAFGGEAVTHWMPLPAPPESPSNDRGDLA